MSWKCNVKTYNALRAAPSLEKRKTWGTQCSVGESELLL
jgi:hypothetical protein